MQSVLCYSAGGAARPHFTLLRMFRTRPSSGPCAAWRAPFAAPSASSSERRVDTLVGAGEGCRGLAEEAPTRHRDIFAGPETRREVRSRSHTLCRGRVTRLESHLSAGFTRCLSTRGRSVAPPPPESCSEPGWSAPSEFSCAFHRNATACLRRR